MWLFLSLRQVTGETGTATWPAVICTPTKPPAAAWTSICEGGMTVWGAEVRGGGCLGSGGRDANVPTASATTGVMLMRTSIKSYL